MTLDHEPGTHETHVFVELDPSTVDQVPSWQFKQVEAAEKDDQVPGRHDLHTLDDDAPRTVPNIPDPQAMQVWRVEAMTDDHVPAIQFTHCETEVA